MKSLPSATPHDILYGPKPPKQEVKPYKGIVVFNHKTGGDLMPVSQEQYDILAKDAKRPGYGSNLNKKFNHI